MVISHRDNFTVKENGNTNKKSSRTHHKVNIFGILCFIIVPILKVHVAAIVEIIEGREGN
jgi:CTP-dependent riboflavin kinase